MPIDNAAISHSFAELVIFGTELGEDRYTHGGDLNGLAKATHPVPGERDTAGGSGLVGRRSSLRQPHPARNCGVRVRCGLGHILGNSQPDSFDRTVIRPRRPFREAPRIASGTRGSAIELRVPGLSASGFAPKPATRHVAQPNNAEGPHPVRSAAHLLCLRVRRCSTARTRRGADAARPE